MNISHIKNGHHKRTKRVCTLHILR